MVASSIEQPIYYATQNRRDFGLQAEVAAAANALGQLGGKLVSVQEVESVSEGAGGSRRTAVVVAKARRTPAQYPRKPGVPAKRPL